MADQTITTHVDLRPTEGRPVRIHYDLNVWVYPEDGFAITKVESLLTGAELDPTEEDMAYYRTVVTSAEFSLSGDLLY